MESCQPLPAQLSAWANGMERFYLPQWDELPQFELYMDQVIVLLKQHLSPLPQSEEERVITASIINNYVRLKLLPPPVKKKYARIHLACLLMICLLKQSLSMADIRKLLPEPCTEEAVKQAYTGFTRQYRAAVSQRLAQIRASASPAEDDPITAAAIDAHLAASLAAYLLNSVPPVE